MAKGLPQWGGEGIKNYQGNKSDATLKQLGGEGSTSLGKANTDIAFTPGQKPNPKYTGPGRDLTIEDF